jgi:hypothetical protein
MIGKTILGKSFQGIVEYLFSKKEGEAELLLSQGIRDYDKKLMIQDFEDTRSLRPTIGNAVWHSCISFHQSDKDKLSNNLMKEIAEKFIQEMGLDKSQYLVVRHKDRGHDHFHVLANRITMDGQVVKDNYCKARTIQACKKLEGQYPQFKKAQTKDLSKVNQDRLKGKDKIKYEIYTSILTEIKNSRNIEELIKKLENHGISSELKYKRGSIEEVQGIKFGKGKIWFSGSKIDRQCSYANLCKAISHNQASSLKNLGQKQPLLNEPVIPGGFKKSKVDPQAIIRGMVSNNTQFDDPFDPKKNLQSSF